MRLQRVEIQLDRRRILPEFVFESAAGAREHVLAAARFRRRAMTSRSHSDITGPLKGPATAPVIDLLFVGAESSIV
jgi:hypothetical protein